MYICTHIYVYVYIYIYTHVYSHTHTHLLDDRGQRPPLVAAQETRDVLEQEGGRTPIMRHTNLL